MFSAPSRRVVVFVVVALAVLVFLTGVTDVEAQSFVFHIDYTTNDCLDGPGGQSAIEMALSDASGTPLVDTSWNGYSCSLSSANPGQLLDFSSDNMIYYLGNGYSLRVEPGVVMSISWLDLVLSDDLPGFSNAGDLTIGTAEFDVFNTGTYDYRVFVNEGKMTFLQSPYIYATYASHTGYSGLNFVFDNRLGAELNFYNGADFDGVFLDNTGLVSIYDGIFDLTNGNNYGQVDLYCIPLDSPNNNLLGWYPEFLYRDFFDGNPIQFENCQPQAWLFDMGPHDVLRNYAEWNGWYSWDPVEFYITDQDRIEFNDQIVQYVDDTGNLEPSWYMGDQYFLEFGPNCQGCQNPTKGTLSLYDPTATPLLLVYTPDPGAYGVDGFTYRLCDDTQLFSSDYFGPQQCSEYVNVKITIVTAPVTAPDTATTLQQNGVDIEVLANDYDLDGVSAPLAIEFVSWPTSGNDIQIVSQNGMDVVHYQPAPDFSGYDHFSYRLCDLNGYGLCSPETSVDINVIPNPGPVTSPDSANTVERTPVAIYILDNDTASQGLDQSSLALDTAPLHGSASVYPSLGFLEYQPYGGYIGVDTFTYTVCDLPGVCSDPTLVTVYIGANTPPVGGDDEYTTLVDTPISFDVTLNDYDVDHNLSGEINVDSPVSHGVLSQQGDFGDFIYTPNAGFVGTDSFTYRIDDVAGGAAYPTVTIHVTDLFTFHLSGNDPNLPCQVFNTSVMEGQPASLSCSLTLPGFDNLTSSVGTAGYSNGTFTWSFNTADGPAESAQVVVTVNDTSGPIGYLTFDLDVQNGAPMIEAMDLSPIGFGLTDPLSVSVDFSDPAWTHDEVYTCSVDFGDGAVVAGTVSGFNCTASHTYPVPGMYVVSVTITDKDGASVTMSSRDFANSTFFVFDLSSLENSGLCTLFNLDVDEGQTAGLNCNLHLPSGVSVFAAPGTAGYNTSNNGNFLWFWNTKDGPYDSGQIDVSVSDSSGVIGYLTFNLTVHNVAPTIESMSLSPSVLKQGNALFVSAAFSDPATDLDKVYTCSVDFGDGAVVPGTVSGFNCTASHVYSTPGIYVVYVTITDKDGGSVTKSNLDFNSGGEGLFAFDLASLKGSCSLLNLDVLESQRAELDCGIHLPDGVTIAPSAGTANYNGTRFDWYLDTSDGPADSAQIVVDVSDGSGMLGSLVFDLTVRNAPPSIDSMTLSPGVLQEGEVLQVSAGFSDFAQDLDQAYTCSVDFGDGTVMAGTVSGYSCTASHAYSTPGIYTVYVTITDKDGGSVTKSNLDFSDAGYVVVYDSSGGVGFVTGGGWIDSPAGAYIGDPGLTGKANFGFVSRYKKGASVPTGSTEFRFQAGSLNFHSTSYQWLVVNQNGTNAQFRGSGTINGAQAGNGEDYEFMIWAGDGTSDTFRIKIWYDDGSGSDAVVYDNGVSQSLGGGSIVIH